MGSEPSPVKFHDFCPPTVAPRRLHLALALAPLAASLATPLLLTNLAGAQALGEGEPAASPPLAPAPAAAPAPPPPPPPPVRVQAPAATAPLTAPPEVRISQPARRFDDSLDELERERVITPQEAGKVRIHNFVRMPTAGSPSSEACRSGALSAQECATGRIRPRLDGQLGGSTDPAGLLSGDGDGAARAGRFGIAGEGFQTDASPLPPISVPVSALLAGPGGNFRLTDVFQVTPRPAAIAGNSDRRLLFPIIGSAVNTSNFGYRLHPVLGSWLMHSGKDLAAPEGTPVVAALSGRVLSSGVAGGYGLAIEIEHDRPRRRTLYGHLSELYVKPGDRVRQGEVIGRVGSTGLSTGPHLHFELRIPQDGGWVAVDPGDFDPGSGAPALIAGLPGLAGLAGLLGGQGSSTDAVSLLMGQLLQTLERPQAPVAQASAPRP
ncbi:MAG: M23 family metallopeptidase [Cyanobacteriota bacterium]|nr:M23 family metallopeptidase [Cyanobacteriota bacterium]